MLFNNAVIPAVRSALSEAIHTALSSRYLRRNEGTTDYATIPEVTLSGQGVVEFDVLTSFTTSTQYVFDSSESVRFFCLIGGAGTISTVAGLSVTIDGGPNNFDIRDGSFHTVRITGNMSGLSINSLYQRFSNSERFQGILANLKIWDNGTLIRDYPLDDNSDILRNRAAVLGGELYTFDGLTDWSEPRSSSTLSLNGGFIRSTADGVGTQGSVLEVSGLIVGSRLLVNIDIDRGTNAGQIRLRFDSSSSLAGGGFANFTNPTDGNTIAVINVTATTMYFGTISTGHAAGQYHDIKINSIHQADGYGTVINPNAGDWGLFQQQVTGEWLGQELVANGGFDDGLNGWTFGNGASGSVISGQMHMTQDTTGNGQMNTVVSPLRGGLSYYYSVNLISNNGVRPPAAILNNTFFDLVEGVNTFEINSITATGVTAVRHSNEAAGVASVIDSVSVKEVLNIA